MNRIRRLIGTFCALFRSNESESETENTNRNAVSFDPSRLMYEDFRLLKTLGTGFGGSVFLCEYKGTGDRYAIKAISKVRTIMHSDGIKCLTSERQILQMATANRDPFLVHMYGSFQNESHVFFVMEYMVGGDLSKYIENGPLSERDTVFYSACIILGIQNLHKNNIIYRDLKLFNILVGGDGYVKIADFGLSKQNIGPEDRTSTHCGTSEYMAPEIVQEKPYTRVVDWWSLGIVIFELLTGQVPFTGRNEAQVYKAIGSKNPTYPRDMSDVAVSLIRRLLEKDPTKRLGSSINGAEDVKNDPFFRNIQWDLLQEKTVEPPFIPNAAIERLESTNLNVNDILLPLPRRPNPMLTSKVQRKFKQFSTSNN